MPVESLIRERQASYSRVLRRCDRLGDCSPFLDFSLNALGDALEEFVAEVRPEPQTADSRLAAARARFGASAFSRADYLGLHQRLSTATASRDLAHGVGLRVLVGQGDRATAIYRFRPARVR